VTNTLHRYGDSESFHDDYIVFAMPCRGINDEGSLAKLKTFLRICAEHGPVNMGTGKIAAFSGSPALGPRAHWRRDIDPDFKEVIETIDERGAVTAVFDSPERLEACLGDVIDADLGLSVNVSTSVQGAIRAAAACGIKRHSVEYSLGFFDPHDHLPDGTVLGLSTMCGHGMVSAGLAHKMLEMVREGRRTPAQAAATMARFCPCGAYNPSRAVRLLEEACRPSG